MLKKVELLKKEEFNFQKREFLKFYKKINIIWYMNAFTKYEASYKQYFKDKNLDELYKKLRFPEFCFKFENEYERYVFYLLARNLPFEPITENDFQEKGVTKNVEFIGPVSYYRSTKLSSLYKIVTYSDGKKTCRYIDTNLFTFGNTEEFENDIKTPSIYLLSSVEEKIKTIANSLYTIPMPYKLQCHHIVIRIELFQDKENIFAHPLRLEIYNKATVDDNDETAKVYIDFKEECYFENSKEITKEEYEQVKSSYAFSKKHLKFKELVSYN